MEFAEIIVEERRLYKASFFARDHRARVETWGKWVAFLTQHSQSIVDTAERAQDNEIGENAWRCSCGLWSPDSIMNPSSPHPECEPVCAVCFGALTTQWAEKRAEKAEAGHDEVAELNSHYSIEISVLTERAEKAEAAAKRLVALLKEHQWSYSVINAEGCQSYHCPQCGNPENCGEHANDCAIGAEIAEGEEVT